MLTKLEIKNGIMSPQYDIYNNLYTVSISEEESLDIEYEAIDDSVNVEIVGNEKLCDGENEVYINVSNDNDFETIKLLVYKNNVNTTAVLENYISELNVKKEEEIPSYIAPLIACICFFLILIIFAKLFHKRKNT